MKALSLWQPWASAVVLGSKRYETRSWATGYRGPLVIHAAKRRNVYELIHYGSYWCWCGALGRVMGDNRGLHEALPFGALLGIVDLVDCVRTDAVTVSELDVPRQPSGLAHAASYEWTERMLGNFAPSRFAWRLANPRAFEKPIPWRGAQGLFSVPDDAMPLRSDDRGPQPGDEEPSA